MKTSKFLYLIILSLILITSCSDDDSNPVPVNEEEVITTVIVSLNPTGPGTTITLESRDLDGDGPDAPVITVSSSLEENMTYTGSLDVLNETETPSESITTEIEEEDEDHQFFFSSDNDLISTTYLDVDSDGNPVGLLFSLTTTSAGTGVLTVILRHEPNKSAEGVSEGDITNAGGETDILVSFPISVE